MIRKTMKLLLVALIASFALSSFAEAAPPKKTVRPRAKHSTRVTAGSTAKSGGKRPAAKKPAASAKKKRAAASKTGAKRPAAKRKPSTKPR